MLAGDMSAEIIPLPGARIQSRPTAHYLRIGETGHRQLETMFAEGISRQSALLLMHRDSSTKPNW
jgi:hypothetical protein